MLSATQSQSDSRDGGAVAGTTPAHAQASHGAPVVTGPPAGCPFTSLFGAPLPTTDDSLKAGDRGPMLLEDFHFVEKLQHFDRERIPERVVHARGTGMFGHFEPYGPDKSGGFDISAICRAAVFKPGTKTPVFLRLSTVQGSRGSPDNVRDVRGFATKFYTSEGIWDLVGNNIPVFFIQVSGNDRPMHLIALIADRAFLIHTLRSFSFLSLHLPSLIASSFIVAAYSVVIRHADHHQDGIKFPDLVHALKPEPNFEMPQAATAHDNFWDFISQMPEATHMVMWILSDRAVPRTLRTIQGFGVHTFVMQNERGDEVFVRLQWIPKQGLASNLWDEQQKCAGKDPDFSRRDMYDNISAGIYPEWEMGIQVIKPGDEDKFDFDILDSTKIWCVDD